MREGEGKNTVSRSKRREEGGGGKRYSRLGFHQTWKMGAGQSTYGVGGGHEVQKFERSSSSSRKKKDGDAVAERPPLLVYSRLSSQTTAAAADSAGRGAEEEEEGEGDSSDAQGTSATADQTMSQVAIGDYSVPIDFQKRPSSDRLVSDNDTDLYSEPYHSLQTEAFKKQQEHNKAGNLDYELAKPMFDIANTSNSNQIDFGKSCQAFVGESLQIEASPISPRDQSTSSSSSPVVFSTHLTERQYSVEPDTRSHSSAASSQPESPVSKAADSVFELQATELVNRSYDEPWDSEHSRIQFEEKAVAAEMHSKPVSPSGGDPRYKDTGVSNYEEPWDLAQRQRLLQEKFACGLSEKTPLDTSEYLEPRSAKKQTGMYEEPWDSLAKQKQIEDKLQATHIRTSPQRQLSGSQVLLRVQVDTEQGNYDVPWDSGECAKAISELIPGRGPDVPYRPVSSPPVEPPPSPSHRHRDHWVKQPRPQFASRVCERGEMFDRTLALEKQRWYHGNVTRLQAEQLLRLCKEGSYLVRKSASSKGEYSLSIKGRRSIMHIRIAFRNEVYILGEFSEPFRAVPDMIYYYSQNILRIKDADHLLLQYPVSPNMV